MKPSLPTEANIARAGEVLREGGLVIFPTETVYGIGANALDPAAVARIFASKGRPAENPLIVHVHSIAQAQELVSTWTAEAGALSSAFWPGPLSLILAKNQAVPVITTAGLPSVALRMPSDPVALALIRAAGVPLAAPSANPFMALSPTRVEHLDPALMSGVEVVIDGGPTRVGIESTVVDLTGDSPEILRPGDVSRAAIEDILGNPVVTGDRGEIRSPGQYPKHYSPKAPVRIVEKVSSPFGLAFEGAGHVIQMPASPGSYAAALYDALNRLDALNPSEIEVEAPPRTAEWEAVWDRLSKAAGEPA